jgi:7-cyano-7-deazaguanine reductase
MSDLTHAPLGKPSHYAEHYDASLLFAIARENKRDELHISQPLPFKGIDIWNAYELSWLNTKGKPIIATAEISVPCNSPNIFESKSLKLYFNSFNQSQFDSVTHVHQIISHDLSAVTQAQVDVKLIMPEQFAKQHIKELPGQCLDDLDIEVNCYHTNSNFLTTGNHVVTETVKSHLLKSNCLITHQPDWGSIMIEYTGKKIEHAGLLQYLISFRQHNEFHEQCVERIFMDIMQHCQPGQLSVYARYTRRGGIDINPFRSTHADTIDNFRNYRQ